MNEQRLIDANALKRRFCISNKALRCYVEAEIDAAPTVDAEPVRRGRWVQDDTWKDMYFCSACMGRDHRNKPKHKFCPECGAKMDEVSE